MVVVELELELELEVEERGWRRTRTISPRRGSVALRSRVKRRVRRRGAAVARRRMRGIC
jgi:hypothetical protein